jgi:hypothetical protein
MGRIDGESVGSIHMELLLIVVNRREETRTCLECGEEASMSRKSYTSESVSFPIFQSELIWVLARATNSVSWSGRTSCSAVVW